VWKTGYYDPSFRIFIETVDGRLRTDHGRISGLGTLTALGGICKVGK
jgi:hypothetical protein